MRVVRKQSSSDYLTHFSTGKISTFCCLDWYWKYLGRNQQLCLFAYIQCNGFKNQRNCNSLLVSANGRHRFPFLKKLYENICITTCTLTMLGFQQGVRGSETGFFSCKNILNSSILNQAWVVKNAYLMEYLGSLTAAA